MRDGESARAYARRNHYSMPWAEWVSKRVRSKLGVATIGEAVAMSELAGFDARLGGLEKKLDDAISKLTAAVTPQETRSAADSVRSIQDELRSRGLTLGDLDDAAARKQDAKIDERVAAALDARAKEAEEALAAAEAEKEEEQEEENEPKRDGLGGVRNLLGGSSS